MEPDKKLSKGVSKINSSTPEERKEFRKDVIEACRNMIAKGYSYKQKIDTLATLYGVTTRMAKKYIQWTNEDIDKRKQEKDSRGRDYMMIQLEALYRELFSQGKFVEASKILNQISDIKGYEAPKNLRIETTSTPKIDLTHLSLEDKIDILRKLNKSDTPEDNQEGEVIEIQ